MSVQTSPVVAALGTPDPTGQDSYGAAPLKTSRFTTRTLIVSPTGGRMAALPRGLKGVMQTPGSSALAAECETFSFFQSH